ncbi:RNA-dependent RNA polymerase VP1 [Eyach virus]|uniref:RNA-directed RNA polymerase n=3 Tax=Eyach virus TaxID=62352 RepID=Q8QVF4_9REOV|nr:RNA-dependent RNA polymerase VP1 [Eyach virus]AAM18342.1 RNA-dependent RNA polymerase VP1 [Eyach virus]
MARRPSKEWRERFNTLSLKCKQLTHTNTSTDLSSSNSAKPTTFYSSSGVMDVRKRLSISESLDVFGDLIDNWDLVQLIGVRSEPFVIENPASYLLINQLLALAGQAHSAASMVFLKSLEYDDTLDTVSLWPYETTPPSPVVPKELLFPPPFNVNSYYLHKDIDIIKAKTKAAVYIENYRAGDVFAKKRSISEGATFEERVYHGAVTMLQRMVKLRGSTIQESFVIAVASYRCSECVRRMMVSDSGTGSIHDINHICIMRSNALRWLKMLFFEFPEFPFLMTRDGIKFASNCGAISTQLPLLFFQTLELMILTMDGTLSSTWEGWACYEWYDRARVGLFSEMFERRGVVAHLREAIFRQSDLLRYQSRGLQLASISQFPRRSVQVDDLDKRITEGLDKLNPKVADFIKSWIFGVNLSDEKARWLAVAMKTFASALLYVMGATSLSLEQSAQGTLGIGDPISFPRQEILLDGEWIAVDWYYADPDLADMREIGMALVSDADPEYADWEYGFFNVQTTNSAGNVKEVIEERRKQLVAEFGDQGKLLAKVENTRILDAVQKITSTFQNPQDFCDSADNVRKAGERHQVGRRPRVIQMVGTEGQLSAFVLHNVLRPAYKKTRFTTSGKNSGDIRDMNIVLEISGELGYKSSLDVKGMDSSTKPFQTNLSLSCVFHRLRGEVLGYPPFFLGSMSSSKENYVLTRTRYRNEHGVIVAEEEYKLTYPQYVLLLGAVHWTSPTRFTDGYFQEFVMTSRTVFRSGLLNTADQHTFLGVIMYTLLEKRLKQRWYGQHGREIRSQNGHRREALEVYEEHVRLLGSVLGDDQVAGAFCRGIVDEDVILRITRDLCDETKFLMERLGYECEPEISEYSAEFLKQKGVLGAPELFPERLLLFSSERGDMAGSLPLDRVKIMLSMIDEKIGRARCPLPYASLMLFTSWISGTASFSIGEGGKLLYRTGRNWKKVYASKKTASTIWKQEFVSDGVLEVKWNKLGLFYKEWSTAQTGTILIGCGLLWACSDALGVPFPPLVRTGEILCPGTSVYTIPSNAMTHYLLWATQRDRATAEQMWCEVREQLVRGEDDPLGKYIDYVNDMFEDVGVSDLPYAALHIYGVGMGFVAGVMPVPMEVWYDFDLFGRVGGFGTWIAEIVFKDIRIEREKYDLPRLSMWKNAANHLLPSEVRRSSLYARDTLHQKYGMLVPSTVLIAERPGCKIDQALFEVRRVGMEDVQELEKVLDELTRLKNPERKFMKRLAMGLFTVEKLAERRTGYGPAVAEKGWGHIVPPASFQSRVVECLSFPMYNGFNYEAVRERVFVDGKLPGDPKLYLKVGRQALSYSEEAYSLVAASLGLSSRQAADMRDMIIEGINGLEEARFALNPRKTFLFDVSRRKGAGFFRTPHRRKTNQAYCEMMGMALLLMEPWRFSSGDWRMSFSHRLRAVLGRR